MNLLDSLKQKNTILNTKGSEYYHSAYDNNLDVFTLLSRNMEDSKVLRMFHRALDEDASLALANLLYLLDIRNGKGERRLFKLIYLDLCLNYPTLALKVLPFIGELGRYDYLLVGINTPIEKETLDYIYQQLSLDMTSEYPSLLAKWLPSHRTHGKNSLLARKLMKAYDLSEQEYRKILSSLRSKLNIIEKNLTNKDYDKIEFAKVPSKAMLKYNRVFNAKIEDRFNAYKESLKEGKTKVNTKGLFAYEIVGQVYNHRGDNSLYDLMWEQQKDILHGNKSNILVVADTSGSMLSYKGIPYFTSVGLAIYLAEHNKGFFHNHFITFSDKPTLQEVRGKTLTEKIANMEEINAWNTDIDLVFKLILDAALQNNLQDKDLPSHIIIISDMEFDTSIYSKEGTNYQGWRQTFKDKGYKLPTIIFWNVAGNSLGTPITKFDNDVAMISGFSTHILENLLSLESYTPLTVMQEKLSTYLELLKD